MSSSYTSSFRRYGVLLVLITGILWLGFMAATEWLIAAKVRPYVWAQYANPSYVQLFNTGRTTDVIFGDSYLAQGIHGLEGFVNLAYPGDNIRLTELKVRDYFGDKQPRRVILQADPQLFASTREVINLGNETEKILPGGEMPSRPTVWMLTYPHRGLIYTYWKRYLTGEGFGDRAELLPQGGIISNAVWADEDEDTRLRRAHKVILHEIPVKDVGASENGLAYERMLIFLATNGAEVCMVGAPMSDEYRLISNDFIEYGETREFLVSLAAHYGFTYLNLADRITDATMFADQNHLNAHGAAVFTQMLESGCFRHEVD